MDDKKILKLFLVRDEQAIAETERNYGAYGLTIARNILKNDADAEEVLADALLRMWNSIPPNCPESLRLYLGKIVRNLALDRWRAENASKRGSGRVRIALDELDNAFSGGNEISDYLDIKELGRSISLFLQKQALRDRDIFLRRYYYLEDVALIASRFGLKESNVHQILSRIRRKLKDHLVKEGYVL